MKRILIVLSLVLAFSGATFAQSDKAQQATATLQKMRQIDLLNYIVPLALTKEQIRKLLPAIELARRDVKTQEAEEQKLIGEKAAAIDKAVKDGIENGDVPDKQFLKELNALIRFMSMKRDAIANDNTEKVLTAMKEALNVGQLKVAGNSLNPRVFDSSIKIEEMKDDDRLKLFVREIMLDPLAYDLLVKIQAGKRG